jgi:hypothetical protein
LPSACRNQELTVSKSDATEIINQYVCVSNDVVHHVRVQWPASEPRGTPNRGQYLVAVEVLPEHDVPKNLHLMFRRSIAPHALVKLLADAVEKSAWEMVLVAHGS